MSLNVQVFVPGLITINYPINRQTLTAFARLNGNIYINREELPEGTQYIKNQIPSALHPEVLESHSLRGKRYWIESVRYFVDGNIFRELNFIDDQTPFYQFDEDYIPNFIGGDEVSPGGHKFQVAVVFFSLDNPGVKIVDVAEIEYIYDNTAIRVIDALVKITPPQVQGRDDSQLLAEAMDYILTQRTEGSLKDDIDALQDLYDIDNVPDALLPYLAATVGYDYFSGSLGTASVREELRFLATWQKKAGTKGSILTLLRAQRFDADINPLYLDLTNNTLRRGGKQRFNYQDSIRYAQETVVRRISAGFTHGNNFVPDSVIIRFNAEVEQVDGTIDFVQTFEAVWDDVANVYKITQINTGGSPSDPVWLVYADDGTPVSVEGIIDLNVDQLRRGFTMTFDRNVRITPGTTVTFDYVYEIDSRPGRNTRLSEFFDLDIRTLLGPNQLTVGDYRRLVNVVLKSKPLRTKLRQLRIPLFYADAYVVNTNSYSTTGQTGNRDRIDQANIDEAAVQLSNPVRDILIMRHNRRMIDGFKFTWERDCDRWENRFSMYKTLDVDPFDFDPVYRERIRQWRMLHRQHAIILRDDADYTTDEEKRRWLVEIDRKILNFKGGDEEGDGCKEATDYTDHMFTLAYPEPCSPAIQEIKGMFMELDTVTPIDSSNAVRFLFDFQPFGSPGGGLRDFYELSFDDTGMVEHGDYSGTALSAWDVDIDDRKEFSWTYNSVDLKMTFIRFQTDEALELFFAERPELDNMPFHVGGSPDPKWYAILDVTGDFYVNPFHVSIEFNDVYANFQNACECCQTEIGTIDGNAPVALAFDQTLDESYHYADRPYVEVVRVEDNRPVQVFEWRGGYWEQMVEDDPNITVSLDPFITASGWTNNGQIKGSASYVGPAPGAMPAYSYLIRYCARLTGDRLRADPSLSFTDEWSKGILRRGVYGVINGQVYYSPFNIAPQDLFEHKHDQDITALAYDSHYFRDQNLFPGLRMTILMDSAAAIAEMAQLVYDTVGHEYDSYFFYDGAPASARYLRVSHFPKKLVFETLDTFNPASAPFETPA